MLESRSTSSSSTSSASSASSTNTIYSASTSTSTSASSASSTCSSANSEDRCTSPVDSPGRGSPLLGNASQGTEAERTASANPVPDPTPRASWRWPFGRAGSPLPPWQRGRPTALAARPAPMRMDQAYGPPSFVSPMRMRRVANALLRRLSRPPRGTTDAGRATTAPGTFSTVAAATSPLHEGCTFLDRLAQVEARDASGSCDVGLVPQPMRCGGTSSSLDVVGARELRADAATPTEAAIAAETATIAAIRMAARVSTNPSFDEACDATTCFILTYDATSCAEEKEIDFEVSTQNMDLHLPSSANFLERLAEAEARDARLLAETSV